MPAPPVSALPYLSTAPLAIEDKQARIPSRRRRSSRNESDCQPTWSRLDDLGFRCRRRATGAATPAGTAPACPGGDTGITLSPGFCATIFADNLGHIRHLVVAPDGIVYANSWSGRYYHNDKPPADGFLLALQDTDGTGRPTSFGGSARPRRRAPQAAPASPSTTMRFMPKKKARLSATRGSQAKLRQAASPM